MTKPILPGSVWFLFAAGVILRAAWLLHAPPTSASIEALPDQREYVDLARHWLGGEGYWLFDPRFGQRVYAYRTPGYPAVIAACGGSAIATCWVQVVLDASIVIPVFWIGRRCTNDMAGLVACLLVSVNPLLIFFASLLLSDSVYTAILVWSMGLVMLSKGSRPVGILLGILGVLVRPSGSLLPIALAGLTGASLRARTRDVVLSVLATVLVLLPWAARNHRVLGRWVWLTTNSGITMFDGLHAGASGGSDQRFIDDFPMLRDMNELERSNFLSSQANAFITAHPVETIRLAVIKIARTWSPVPLSVGYQGRPYWAVGLLYSLPIMLLAAAAMVAVPMRAGAKIVLLVPMLYFTLIHAASVGSLRYRLPIEPFIAIAASALIAAWMPRATVRES